MHLCGEVLSDSACGDRTEYPANSWHPVSFQGKKPDSSAWAFSSEWQFWTTLPTRLVTLPIAKTASVPGAADWGISLNAALKPNARADQLKRYAVLLGSDREIDLLWRRAGLYARRLRAGGYQAVIAPAFSTWWNRSPFDGLYELKRTEVMAKVLARRLPTIPSIAWRNERDIERWVLWLTKSLVSEFCVDLGTFRTEASWKWALEGIRLLDSLADRPRTLVVAGPSRLPRIAEVGSAWPHRLIVASKHPWQLGIHGRRLLPKLREEPDLETSSSDLVQFNVETFDLEVRKVLGERSGQLFVA